MYRAFFQLKDQPFRLTPDPRFLHLAEPHQAALTTLLEGIFYRKGLVMITGPIGTGKTTLVHGRALHRRGAPAEHGIARRNSPSGKRGHAPGKAVADHPVRPAGAAGNDEPARAQRPAAAYRGPRASPAIEFGGNTRLCGRA